MAPGDASQAGISGDKEVKVSADVCGFDPTKEVILQLVGACAVL